MEQANFKENFKVFVRVRPFIERELIKSFSFPITDVAKNHDELHVYEFVVAELRSEAEIKKMLQNPKCYQIHQFRFDRVFDDQCSQADVFSHTTKPAIDRFFSGYNAAVFAYGQTGTGKTHTIEGTIDQPGLLYKAVEEVTNALKSWKKGSYLLTASYMQIYNENLADLLQPIGEKNAPVLNIKKNKDRGVYVENVKEVQIETPVQAFDTVRLGVANRSTAVTAMNALSSRSHAIFSLNLTKFVDEKTRIVSKLHLIDLAGSERITLTGVTGDRLKETKKINTSLSELSNVILALSKKKEDADFVQYRNSKLTRLLEDSLGGNTCTSFIATISPAHEALVESLSTLRFAARAKNIKSSVSLNRKENQTGHLKILERYKNDLVKFKGGELNENELDFSDLDGLSELFPKDKQDGRKANLALKAKNGAAFSPEGEENVLDLYKDMLMTQRDVLIEMTSKLNNKNMEIITLKRQIKEEKKQLGGEIFEIKEGIDTIVEALSKKNASIDLVSIAETLLKLQGLCNRAIKNN